MFPLKSKYLGALGLILSMAAFLRFYNLVYFHDLESDEAVYAQAAFAVSKGYVLYKDIFFASPPVYLYMESVITYFSPNLWPIRAFNVLLGLGTTTLIILLAREIYASNSLSLIAGTLYAFYPFAIYVNKLALIDNGLTFFLTLSLLFFAKYFFSQKKDLKLLIVSGLLAGLSLLTKYSALYVLVVPFILLMYKRRPSRALVFVFCTSLLPLAFFIVLIASNTWPYFCEQTIVWQMIRFGQNWSEKLWSFSSYFATVFPLFLLLIPALTYCEEKDLFPSLWYFVPMLIMLFGKTLFLHYFVMLTPPLCILAAKPINFALVRLRNQKINFRRALLSATIRRRVLQLIAVLIVIMNFHFLVSQIYGNNWLMLDAPFTNPAHEEKLKAKMNAATYINRLTSSNEKIWTSDASLAFLAHRMILEPCSDLWKFQGFFEDVWGYSGEFYRGPIVNYPEGLISLQDILNAWKEYPPEVIVIIRTGYVDQYIWYGIHNSYTNQSGLSDYILSNYDLGPEINGCSSTFYPQNIEIWVKRKNL
jgi:hypothetical protein